VYREDLATCRNAAGLGVSRVSRVLCKRPGFVFGDPALPPSRATGHRRAIGFGDLNPERRIEIEWSRREPMSALDSGHTPQNACRGRRAGEHRYCGKEFKRKLEQGPVDHEVEFKCKRYENGRVVAGAETSAPLGQLFRAPN
jgi:hypothetical protein